MSAKKFNETAEFKRLQKEWYKKAADAGFEDIEKNEDETTIRPQEFTPPSNVDSLEYTEFIQTVGGLDSYELNESILRTYDFKRPIDRVIYQLHTEGNTLRQISEKLPTLGHKALTFKAVDLVIKKIQSNFQRG